MKRLLLVWLLLLPIAVLGQRVQIDQAKQLVQQGDAQAALAVLEQAGDQGPQAADVHTLKAICFALLAKPLESTAEFDKAIALRPTFAPTYLSAGLAYASFDNLEQALARLAMAVKLDPALPGARYNYALILARAGRYAESEQQVDLELGNHSTLDLWRLKARDAYYQNKWQDAVDDYQKALAFDPSWVEGYAALGEALFFLSRSQDALLPLKKAASLDPDNERTHALLGRIYQDAGQKDQAVAEYEIAHRLAPSDREVTYRLFRLYSAQGDKANADRLQSDLKILLAGNHDEAAAEARAVELNNAGIELEKKGDFVGAIDRYDEAAKADVLNLVFQRNAALVLCKTGKPEEAIRRLRNILSLDADDAETLQILAVAKELAAGKNVAQKTLPAPSR